jgi:hypothetical protein
VYPVAPLNIRLRSPSIKLKKVNQPKRSRPSDVRVQRESGAETLDTWDETRESRVIPPRKTGRPRPRDPAQAKAPTRPAPQAPGRPRACRPQPHSVQAQPTATRHSPHTRHDRRGTQPRHEPYTAHRTPAGARERGTAQAPPHQTPKPPSPPRRREARARRDRGRCGFERSSGAELLISRSQFLLQPSFLKGLRHFRLCRGFIVSVWSFGVWTQMSFSLARSRSVGTSQTVQVWPLPDPAIKLPCPSPRWTWPAIASQS